MTTTIRQYTSALLLAAAIVPFMIGAAEAEEFLLGAAGAFRSIRSGTNGTAAAA